MKKIGVVLSGCGYLDGAEIHEAVLTLLALDTAGAQAVCMAPNVEQAKVLNHITGEEMSESRNVLVEAARIARGQIEDIAEIRAEDLDGLALPGGYGAAMNLCDFAERGAEMTVHPDVARLVQAVHAAGKPIAAICIAPALVAKLIPGVNLTIGTDQGTAAALESMGCKHTDCPVTEHVVDAEKKVVTTPAYMLGPWVGDVAKGIQSCIDDLMRMA